MSVKTIHVQDKKLKLGRKRPVARGPRLRLGNYLLRNLPEPPPSVDYRNFAETSLANPYLNRDLGDCVIAGGGHVRGVTSGGAGQEVVFSNDQIAQMYSAIGGYDPNAPLDPNGNNPTDNGCDEQTALNYWTETGFPDGVKLAGWLAVDARDPREYRSALWLFENLFFGIELPDAWIESPPERSGFTWNVKGNPDPNNGHCIVGVGYDQNGVIIDTWGMTGLITDAAVARYCVAPAGGELYTLLSPDMINRATDKAPSGLNWSQLIQDFDSIGGNVPAPPARTRAFFGHRA
jgi:hypothetical protein